MNQNQNQKMLFTSGLTFLISQLTSVHLPHAVIRGYCFEDRVLQALRRKSEALTLVCGKPTSQTQIPTESISVKFAAYSRQDNPLTKMSKGMLYHLRYHHPVIDAVALVEVNKQNWLFLIQLSLSPNSLHKSKASDLWKTVTFF